MRYCIVYGQITALSNRVSGTPICESSFKVKVFDRVFINIIMKCLFCETPLTGYQEKFCSKSCSAKYHNIHFPKKKKQEKKCINCNNNVDINAFKFCKACREVGWHKSYPDKPYCMRTLGYELELNRHAGANKYNKIRGWARQNNKQEIVKCEKCGYDKHVEVAHKKPICSFSLETLLTEINSRKNISFLCPNCHWEHDNL